MIRLAHLEVEHFGPIRQAELDFGGGLNVLYGHNDLGKSYLAHSIRAVLLLPHTSTAHQEFVAWGTDETPRVTLTFQGHDGTFWRVSKAFGKSVGAGATLERSQSGDQWALEAKGRDVDGHLRRLLEWGIPEPGGKGKKLPRGLPQSFLTHVLLAEQSDTLAVFDQSLEGDPDESGKKLLGQALQALAQDPLFKSVLERSQKRVDEAFLPTGNKRRGRNDPFPRVGREIREALAEHERRKKQLAETVTVQEQLEQLSHQRLVAQAARDEAAGVVKALESAAKALQEQAALEAELRDAEDLTVKVNTAESSSARLARELEDCEGRLATAKSALRDAELALEKEKERQRAESDDGVHRRELEREKLEKRLLELQAGEKDIQQRVETARAVGERAAAVEGIERRAEQLRQAASRAEGELAELVEKRRGLEAEQEQLHAAGALLRWTRAVSELEEATEAQERVEELRRRAQELRGESEVGGATTRLPSADELRALRALRQELDVARARIDVGLSVRLQLKQALDLQIQADDAATNTTAGAEGEHLLEAERLLRLQLGELAEIEIEAGAPEVRREAEALSERWRREGEPVLAATGVDDIEGLAEACRSAEEAKRAAGERAAEAARLEGQAAELTELAGQVPARQARLDEREAAIEGYDRSALSIATRLGDDAEAAIAELRRTNGESLAQVNAQREAKRAELDRARSDLEHAGKELTAEGQRRDELAAGLDAPWQEALAASEGDLARLREELATVTEKRRVFDEAAGGEATAARTRLEEAEAKLKSARATVATHHETRDQLKAELVRVQAQLEVLRDNTAKIDLAALRATFGEAKAAMDAVLIDGEPVTEERLAEARQELDSRETALAEASRDVDKLEGALEQVGGDVASEREKTALDALLLAKEREREMELEYGAWRLLVETLREAESEESSHLGRALVGPVSDRFTELTDGRYGKIGLDPDLKTTGIAVGGNEQSVEALSQGLKEQLATIFRISVAQHLDSMIVLDDHLTHTDPERLGWFRDVLRKSGEEIQLIVLTCRPLDYLYENEMGRGEVSDALNGVNLEKIVERVGKPRLSASTASD